MIIGKFKHENGGYAGELYGLGLGVRDVTFSPVPAKLGKGPDFVLRTGPLEGFDGYELGAAWAKTSKKGKTYLSVKLDGPGLVAPIHCALTQQQDGSYVLAWNRKQAQAEADTEAEPAAA